MVGLGVAGTKTLISVSSVRRCTSPWVTPETKPMAQQPRCGYSTNATSRKAWLRWANTVSKICLTAP